MIMNNNEKKIKKYRAQINFTMRKLEFTAY